MPRTAANPTGLQMRKYLSAQAQKRKQLLDSAEALMAEASKIETMVFKPMELNPDAFVNGSTSKPKANRASGNRAKKGDQKAAIIDLLETNGGKITTKQAIEKFEHVGFRTAANAVLMRMAKEGLISNTARGEWEIKSKRAIAAAAKALDNTAK